jgi:hypothetical protein
LVTLTGTTNNGVITYNGSGTDATVESNLTFDGTTIGLTGNILINADVSVQTNSQSVTGTTQMFALSDYSGVVLDYLIKNSSNMRAGTIVGVWDGSNSNLSETTTTDLGNTTAVSFTISNSGTVNAVVTSGTWTVVMFARALSI